MYIYFCPIPHDEAGEKYYDGLEELQEHIYSHSDAELRTLAVDMCYRFRFFTNKARYESIKKEDSPV